MSKQKEVTPEKNILNMMLAAKEDARKNGTTGSLENVYIGVLSAFSAVKGYENVCTVFLDKLQSRAKTTCKKQEVHDGLDELFD